MTKETTPPTTTSESATFGKWIQEQRVKRNVSLEEIAAVTKVHINQLKHLEDDERDKLPAPAFVRGFLISYARHLGLNEDEVLSRFKDGTAPAPAPGTGTMQPIGRASRAAQSASQPKVRLVENATLGHSPATKDLEKPKPKMLKSQNILLMFGAFVLLVGLGMLVSLGKKARQGKQAKPESSLTSTVPTTPTVIVNTPAAPVEAKKEAPPESATAAAFPATKPEAKAEGSRKFALELHSIEQSWVNVRLDDKESSGMILAPGNNYNFEADRKIVLSLSDAGSVEIKWNGIWYAPPGYRGDVKSLTLPDQLAKLSLKTAAKPLKAKKRVKPEGEAPPPESIKAD